MENTIMLPETLSVPTKHCVLMFNILNVVSKRGAINPDEFQVVGELVEFLKKELKVEEQTKQLNEEQTKQLPPVQE
jgi:LytS/YehU family sensor histidine kinase